jgi:hypothetical protein
MFALAFDVGNLRATGAPVPVQDSVVVLDASRPLMALSQEGSMAVRSGAAASTPPHLGAISRR